MACPLLIYISFYLSKMPYERNPYFSVTVTFAAVFLHLLRNVS